MLPSWRGVLQGCVRAVVPALGGGDLGDQLGELPSQVGEQLPRILLGHGAAVDLGVEIASLGDHVGQRLLHVVVGGGGLLGVVIRLVFDALCCSASVIFVLREQRLESLPYALLLLLADQPVAIVHRRLLGHAAPPRRSCWLYFAAISCLVLACSASRFCSASMNAIKASSVSLISAAARAASPLRTPKSSVRTYRRCEPGIWTSPP